MANTGLATTAFWNQQNNKYNLKIEPEDDPVIQFFKNELPWPQLRSCFEAGCFPGGYLAYFGTKGLELNGIDISDRVQTGLAPFYHSQQLKTGSLIQGDFFAYMPEKKFDVVCSFGFIEHFENWQQVMQKHIDLLNTEGYLIITAPNFRGKFQHFFHRFFDKENYQRHYVPSMNPALWKAFLEQQGMEIIKTGYFGKFDFWVEKTPSFFKHIFLAVLVRLKPLAAKFISQGSESYSPYCGIVARKK